MDLRESEVFQRHRPPDVIPISPVDGAKEDSETLEVNFEVVASEKQPVTDARVVVNGVVQSTAAQVQGLAQRRDLGLAQSVLRQDRVRVFSQKRAPAAGIGGVALNLIADPSV